LGKVISIINQKGGVGKTTSAINLAASLAVAERQTLLIDFDPQGNATSGLGFSPEQIAGKTIYEALVGQCSLEDTIKESELPGLFVVPADQNLSGAEVELVGAIAREQKLKKILETLRDRFHYILIDCPPSLGPRLMRSRPPIATLCPCSANTFPWKGFRSLFLRRA
jgi:chromosome partitioning protein